MPERHQGQYSRDHSAVGLNYHMEVILCFCRQNAANWWLWLYFLIKLLQCPQGIPCNVHLFIIYSHRMCYLLWFGWQLTYCDQHLPLKKNLPGSSWPSLAVPLTLWFLKENITTPNFSYCSQRFRIGSRLSAKEQRKNVISSSGPVSSSVSDS